MELLRAEVADALSRLDHGLPSALIVELDSSTRTSPLFAEISAAAGSRGFRGIHVPAVESDQLSATSRLLQALTAGEAAGDDGGAVVDQAAELLDQMTKSSPVVVMVEDADWTDPGSLLALRTLPDLLGHLPICWAIGVVPAAPRPRRLVEAIRQWGPPTIRAEQPDSPTATAQRPAFIKVAAVMGLEFDPEIAARVLDRSVGSLLSEIEAAITTGVLVESGSRLRFADARFRDGLYEGLAVPLRKAVHYEVAKLSVLPGMEAEAVWHLTRSTGRLTEDDLVVVRSAVTRLAAVAPEEAAELALQVSELFPALDPRRVEFVTTAAMHLGNTSRVGEALATLERLSVDGLSYDQEARLRLVAARLHQAAGDDTEAISHVTRALALPGLDEDLRLSLVKAQAAAHMNLCEVDAAARVTRPIVRTARRSPDPAIKASADLFMSQLAFSRAQVTKALKVAEQVASTLEVSGTRPLQAPRIPELWLATVMLSSDRAEEASELLLNGQRHAERRGLAWSVPSWHTVRAIERWMHGAIDDAAVEAETALHAADRLEISRTVPFTRAVLSIIEVDRGHGSRARHLVADAVLSARPRTFDAWTAAAWLRLGGDAEASARAWLETHMNLARLMSLPPVLWPSLVPPRTASSAVQLLVQEAAAVAADQTVIVAAAADAASATRRAAPRPAERATSGWASLTESELRVAALVAAGRTNKAIAEHLHVSVHTVGTHLRHVFTKLDINTRVELTRLALLHGVVTDDPGSTHSRA